MNRRNSESGPMRMKDPVDLATSGRGQAFLQLLAGGTTALVTYLAAVTLLRVHEVSQVAGMVRRKLRRQAAAQPMAIPTRTGEPGSARLPAPGAPLRDGR